jgi:hypothetical protein
MRGDPFGDGLRLVTVMKTQVEANHDQSLQHKDVNGYFSGFVGAGYRGPKVTFQW